MTEPKSAGPLSSDILKQFTEEYKLTVPEKLEKIQQLIDQLREKIDEENLKVLRMHIHKIAGSAGTYGFTTVSEVCIRFEKDLLEKLEKLNEVKGDSAWIESFEAYLEKIKQGFQQ